MSNEFICAAMVGLSFIALIAVFFKLLKEPQAPVNRATRLKLIISGIIAFLADTLGIGSFAVNIFFAKTFNTFKDEHLPAMTNIAQIIPGILEAFFFMRLFEVDFTTLITLIIGTCIGGMIGGATMTRFNKQHIRLAMMLAFSLIIILLLLNQFHLLPVEGDIAELRGKKLMIGFFGMMLCGALTAAGIGLFVMVQAVLFLLQVSPIVAFPVMTISGAMQQPLTAMMFLKQKNLPLNRILMLSMAGCAGVLIGIVLFKHLTTTWLHSLLLGILLYNLIAVGRSWLRHHRRNKDREGVYEQDIAVAGSAVKP